MKVWIVSAHALRGQGWLGPMNIDREIRQRQAHIANLQQHLASLPKRIAAEQRVVEDLQRKLSAWDYARKGAP